MALQVAQVKTGFRDDGTVHPLVLNRRVLEFDTLVNNMSFATAIPKGDMLATWEQLVIAITSALKEGYKVQTPLGYFRLSMRRSGDGKENAIDPSGIHVIFRPDAVLMEHLCRETKIQVLDPAAPRSPHVMKVSNPRANDAPDCANLGKVVNISGARLSFDQEDPDCGVFFWNGGGRETAVRATTYTRIGTARIDVEVPDTLPPGEYNLEVRSRPTKRLVSIIMGTFFVIQAIIHNKK